MTEKELIEFNKEVSQFIRDSRIKECFHYDKTSCSKKIISAHSIQNNKILNLLERPINGNNKVLSFLNPKLDKNGKPCSLKEIGKKDASTFFGFCNLHDTNLFKEIENNEINIESNKHCFLLSYRAFAKDFHAKYETLKGYKTNIFLKTGNKLLSNGLAEGSEIGLRDAWIVKKQIDELLQNENFDGLDYLTYTLDYSILIASAGSFNPNYSYKGKKLNKSTSPEDIYEFVNIVVTPTNDGKTHILLSCLHEQKKSILFLNELEKLPPLKFEKAITSILIAYIENTFISPQLWGVLKKKQQEALLDELELTIPMYKSQLNSFFHSSINFFDIKYKNNT